MSEPTTSPASRQGERDRHDEAMLTWSEVLTLAPALGRLVLLTGERLVVGTADSAASTGRTVVTVISGAGSPVWLLTLGRDHLIGLLRELLGITDIEATLRRLTGDDPASVAGPRPRGAISAAEVTTRQNGTGGHTEGPAEALLTTVGAALPAATPGGQGTAPAPGGVDVEPGTTGTTSNGTTSTVAATPDSDADDADDADDAPPVPAPAAPPAPAPEVEEIVPAPPEAAVSPEPVRPELQERARQLLAQSATLDDDEQHPAFALLLEQLAPDEVRILRVFARHGDQPVVDVESRGPLGGKGRLVAERLSLLSEVSGAKHPDRLPVYLDNLERLRLVRLGDAPLDVADYEVIEAQDAATSARDRAGRGAASARFLRRRLALSAFGAAFCRTCLPG